MKKHSFLFVLQVSAEWVIRLKNIFITVWGMRKMRKGDRIIMRSDRLLHALGEIDEGYISEAAPKNKYSEMTKKERKLQGEKVMNIKKMIDTKKTTGFFKRPMTAAAAILLCVCVTGVTVLAATGELQGYFKNIFGWNGAVVGTKYEQAGEEVEVKLTEVTDHLVMEVVLLYPDKMPYRELDELGIGNYKILDMNNKEIAEEQESEMVKITDGRACVKIPLEGLSAGNYKLVISELTGGKKANQPLALNGTWECVFTK